MKTTVELPDSLIREAQEAAHADETTLKALIEAGLRTILAQREARRTFVLADASVGGAGRQPAFQQAGWEQLREAVYPPRP